MYDEMRFLFEIDPNLKNSQNDSSENLTVDSNNPAQSVEYRPGKVDSDGKLVKDKWVLTKGNSKNYISSDVNKLYETKQNPYLDLIKFTNEDATSPGLKLRSADFAYLRDIGVMPINRLMILRRFPEGTIVPVDLSDSEFKVEPISTLVGWVKQESDLLKLSFSETWTRQGTSDMLHTMLNRIIKDEFGVDVGNIIPVPGWGLGFMFGVLNKMGLTDYDKTNLPIGEPNLLKESITRPHEEFGLKSSLSFTLETNYEQKYIAGIDTTISTMDILNNLLRMGTSDTKFLGKPNSDFLKNLMTANENPTNPDGWSFFIGDVIKKFVDALGETATSAAGELIALTKKVMPPDDEAPAGETEEQKKKREEDKKKADAEAKEKREGLNGLQKGIELGNDVIKIATDASKRILESSFIQSILASTVARYKWPLRGSISMFSGLPSTPWHLTIGNPYAPLLSMNNVYLSNLEVTMGKDMGYNDMAKTMKVVASLEQGRNLGKQEIYEYFGVRYKRHYTNSSDKK